MPPVTPVALRRAARKRLEAQLNLGRRLAKMQDDRQQRLLGNAKLADAYDALHIPARTARRLIALARLTKAAPDLIKQARAGLLHHDHLILVALCIETRKDAALWRRRIQTLTPRELRRQVSACLRDRQPPDGRRIITSPLRLTRVTCGLLTDTQRVASRDHDQPLTLEAALEALLPAARSRAALAPLGQHRYRLVEHPADQPLQPHTICTHEMRVLLDLIRPDWELERTPPPNGTPTTQEPTKKLEARDPDQLDSRARALLGDKLRERLEKAVHAYGRTSHQVGELLLDARDTRAWEPLGYTGLSRMASDLVGLSSSTTSNLVKVAGICRHVPAIDRALRAGEIAWTGLRTVAHLIDEDNADEMLQALRDHTVRGLEQLARQMEAARPQHTRAKPSRPLETIRLALPQQAWLELDAIRQQLTRRLGRPVTDDQLIREVLFLAHSARLGGPYRLAIHRQGDLIWLNGPSGLLQLDERELAEIAAGDDADIEHYDLAAELQWADAAEDARLARTARDAPFNGRSPKDGPGDPLPATDQAPPASERLRRAIIYRDGSRCAVRGCTCHLFLHVHHLVERRYGGGNRPINLYTCDPTCHGLIHSLAYQLRPRPIRLPDRRPRSRRPGRAAG